MFIRTDRTLEQWDSGTVGQTFLDSGTLRFKERRNLIEEIKLKKKTDPDMRDAIQSEGEGWSVVTELSPASGVDQFLSILF